MVNPNTLLKAGLEDLEINLTESQIQGLEIYIREINLWNPRLGLVEAEGELLISHHILDCLAGVRVFQGILEHPRFRKNESGDDDPQNTQNTQNTQNPQNSEGAGRPVPGDLGTGAGLPGLLLSLVLPEYSWQLVEKSGRRCNFLRSCKALIPQAHFQVLQQSMEETPARTLDVITNRAFRPLTPEVLEQQTRILAPDGILCLYKGRLDSISLEAQNLDRKLSVVDTDDLLGILNSPGALKESMAVVSLDVPGVNTERHLVILEK